MDQGEIDLEMLGYLEYKTGELAEAWADFHSNLLEHDAPGWLVDRAKSVLDLINPFIGAWK